MGKTTTRKLMRGSVYINIRVRSARKTQAFCRLFVCFLLFQQPIVVVFLLDLYLGTRMVEEECVFTSCRVSRHLSLRIFFLFLPPPSRLLSSFFLS